VLSGDGGQHSVLDVGILPASGADGPDLSVLGAYQPQVGDWRQPLCRNTNTDAMTVVTAPRTYEPGSNVAFVGATRTNPADHRESLVRGFARTYRFLLRCRDRRAFAPGLLAPFRVPVVRLLVRNSRFYAALLHQVSGAARQANGVSFGLGVERLAQAYADRTPTPAGWQLLAAERSAVLRGDIPVFRLQASGTVLHADGIAVSGVVRQSPYEGVVRRFASLGESDLARQVWLIHRAIGRHRRLKTPPASAVPSGSRYRSLRVRGRPTPPAT
jgi:lantibiotic modifying enzyme